MKYSLPLLVATVTLGAVGFVILQHDETSADVVLEGVSADMLAEGGYELRPASESEAAVPAAGAEAVMKKTNSDGAVSRQTTLVWLSSTREPYTYKDQLVWVVNTDPSTVDGLMPGGWTEEDWKPYRGMGLHPDFKLVFVDAKTGEALFSFERSSEAGFYPLPSFEPNTGTPAPTAKG